MQNKQDLSSEIELVSTLKVISQAYQEISVMRMQKIHSAVIKTREFLESLAEVFYDVKKSYDQYLKDQMSTNKSKEDISLLTLLPKNGKSISIFISSNEKMLGDVTLKVFNAFANHVRKTETDIMILGRIGRQMYKESGIGKPIIYLEISDNIVKPEDMKRIGYYIVNYSKIDVFYGKFESIVNQNAVKANLSGENPFSELETEQDKNKKATYFLFEPSVEKIMQFFETQVFTSLFKQTFNESQLARHASRINAMEEALINIDKSSSKLGWEKKKIKKFEINKGQAERMSGMSVWT